MDGGTDPGGEQFHLSVAEAGTVVKTEKAGTSVFRNGGTDHFHEVHKRIVEKDIRCDNETAGIVNQGDDIKTLLSARGFEERAKAGIAIPDFIDMRAFVAPHVFGGGHPVLFPEGADKPFHGGGGNLSRIDGAVAHECAEDFRGGNLRVFSQQEPCLGFNVIVKDAAVPFVFPAVGHQSVKAMFFVGAVPLFDGGGTDCDRLAIRVRIGQFCGLPEELAVADGGVRAAAFERGNDRITEEGLLLLLVEGHEKSSFTGMKRQSGGYGYSCRKRMAPEEIRYSINNKMVKRYLRVKKLSCLHDGFIML